jgi:hypothetical protein
LNETDGKTGLENAEKHGGSTSKKKMQGRAFLRGFFEKLQSYPRRRSNLELDRSAATGRP